MIGGTGWGQDKAYAWTNMDDFEKGTYFLGYLTGLSVAKRIVFSYDEKISVELDKYAKSLLPLLSDEKYLSAFFDGVTTLYSSPENKDMDLQVMFQLSIFAFYKAMNGKESVFEKRWVSSFARND
jgi:hypothetical protein